MATTTPITGTPIPQVSDSVLDLLEVPDAMLWIEKYGVMRFANEAARNTALSSPVRGMFAIIGNTSTNTYPTWYDGTSWNPIRTIDFTATAATTLVSNTVYGIGTVGVSGGLSVVTGGTDSLTFANAGVVTLCMSYYFPDTTRFKYGQVTDSGVIFSTPGAATMDRFTHNYTAKVAAGETITFQQWIASGTNPNTTWTCNGSFRQTA